ncbi:uncharacterized protein LOC111350904 isoform X1 [Spodoptera litura]|uniref:Uncharacterized protein LOC111350904 isoform X1 n=1 Tax=Spodoptera litura TaxID=69820 RepID=A0A9J7DYJ5_SPOLT|nr:uncharacterized protein LOC111350904 isoform X1 [Spodoptera litura]
MKWSIFVCLLVCLASFCDGLAIKCSPGVTDPSCTEEIKEVDRHESLPGDPTEVQCLVGSEWESNCHYCRCSDEGVAECLKQDTCDKGVFAEPVLCKPNTTFQRDCNTCICLENGLGLCTLEFCRRSGSIDSVPEIVIADTELNNKDEASQPFKTEILVPTMKSAKNKTKSRVCEANRMFIKDCNTCWCNEDGTSYYCTRRVCVPLLPEDQPDIGGIPAENLRVIKKECRPNEVFELDCNMCRCNPDGKSYACTRRACEELPEDQKNAPLSRKVRSLTTEPPKACKPGQEFRMDCNKCLCDNKGQDFSCTRHDCNALNNNHHASAFTGVRSKREISEQLSMQCVPGSVFDRGCNVCKCTDNGQFATCSLKRCKTETEHAPESDQGFRCNPGEQFKRDCNDCTCSADGRSVFCTLRLCDEALTSDI